MAVTDADLASPSHWRARGRGIPPVSTRPRLFINARIMTMDDANPEADAMVIENGRIAAVGEAARAIAAGNEEAEVIDCAGRFLLPGFIEPHMHFLPIASLSRFEDVGPFRYDTVRGALARLQEVAAEAGANDSTLRCRTVRVR